jgi:hypothetical protein
MLKLAADENFNQKILRGLNRRNPSIGVVRIQDRGLKGANDASVLSWAASEERVILTHDAGTMTKYAYERVRTGLPMPGVIEVGRQVPLGMAIEDILLLWECSLEGEWEGQIIYLPLQ